MITGAGATGGGTELLRTVADLFPSSPVEVGRHRRGEMALRLVPSGRRPKMLVPADVPLAAAGALDRGSANDSAVKTVGRRLLVEVMRRPSLVALAMPQCIRVGPGEESIQDYLSEVCGEPVRISLMIGARRANRKPVLNVHRLDGTEVGYAKVGLTTLAGELVHHEAAVLSALADPTPSRFRAPRLIHAGCWSGSSVLLMEALRPGPSTRRGRFPTPAVVELSRRDGLSWQPWRGSPWLLRIHETVQSIQEPDRTTLRDLLDRSCDVHGALDVPHGRWHGDLGPWNMAWHGDTPMIWDWERSAPNVPVGMDAVHYTSHSALRAIGQMAQARTVLERPARAAVSSVLDSLVPGHEPQLVGGVISAYLLTMASRFLADASRPGGSAVTTLGRWYAAVLAVHLSDLEGRTSWS